MAQTVFVGLSGGVDSAVSAALLKERGFNVVGVFIKIWRPEFIECTWREDRVDAMRVAVSLGIPFCEIDLSLEYKNNIIDTMISAYARGVTPNPDVLCNKEIKFGSFLEFALREGADYIATGHYARTQKRADGYDLLRGIDTNKDQSYFLYTLGQHELSHSFFPVGGMSKDETRRNARRLNLPVARKPDSQGLCFIGAVTLPDFLGRFIKEAPGPVLDMAGLTIGEHPGAAHFTIGQRHGFTLIRQGDGAPHYVVSIDTKRNALTVSRDRAHAASLSCTVDDIHLTRSNDIPERALAQTRYREKAVPVSIEGRGTSAVVQFDEPHVVAPGQSLVLYNGDVCLGGGIIKELL